MRLALTMAKMANGGFLCTAVDEMQHLIKKPRTEVRKGKKRGVEFPGHKKVKPTWERHLALVYNNHTAGYLRCENGTAKNPQTHWLRKGTAAPLPRTGRTCAQNTISARNTTCATRGHYGE